MSEVGDWLERRAPPPPPELASWIEVTDDGEVHESLTAHALASLSRARAAPGRVRESACHLLVADALLTYACEAALDSEEPRETLSRILERAASPDP